MTTMPIQYLGGGDVSSAIDPDQASRCLRAACERLRFSIIIIGWNLPEALIDVCREEAEHASAQLYLWHPLLCSDGGFALQQEWRTINLQGEAVHGYQDMPDFTFICPNKPEARQTAINHLDKVLRTGSYHGMLLRSVPARCGRNGVGPG